MRYLVEVLTLPSGLPVEGEETADDEAADDRLATDDDADEAADDRLDDDDAADELFNDELVPNDWGMFWFIVPRICCWIVLPKTK